MNPSNQTPPTSSNPRRKSQYHHYIPRFLLRYFTVEAIKQGPFNGPDQSGAFVPVPRQKTKGKVGRRFQPLELLNIYRFDDACLTLGADTENGQFLSRNGVDVNFGLADLYTDPHASSDVHRVEKKFAKLEGDAARIIRQIVSVVSNLGESVLLTRAEVNQLRKFLFLLPYRNEARWSQFADLRFDEATLRSLQAHISKHLTHKPGASSKDVWLQAIEEILDTVPWEINTNEKIFVHDRVEYWSSMKDKRLVIYRASDSNEFLLAANGQGFVDARLTTSTFSREFSENRNDILGNVFAGLNDGLGEKEIRGHGMHDWIKLFPISPTLLLALVDINLWQARNGHPEALKNFDSMFPGPPSRFYWFPFPGTEVDYHNLSPKAAAARVSSDPNVLYKDFWEPPTTADGIVKIDGKVTESRVEDRLTFSIGALTTEQVMLVNSLYLENARHSLAFRSPSCLYRSLLRYEGDDINSWKHERDYAPLRRQLRMTFTAWPGQLRGVSPTLLASAPAQNRCRHLTTVNPQPYTKDQLDSKKYETNTWICTEYRWVRMGLPTFDGSSRAVRLRYLFNRLNRTHDDVASRMQEAHGRVASRF